MTTEEKLIVVDGYSLVFRAYHSMPALSRPDGTPVGAVYGFVSMMLRLMSSIKATHMVMVFDSGGKNFRHEIYPDYKAHRPPVPEDLRPQFPLMRLAAQALNIPVLEQKGYEADDIIATLANRAIANQEEVLIVSGDKDLMQLVNGHTKMYDAVKDKIVGAEQVFEKFGVYPDKIHDLLSMVGDAADNIPGIMGIGPKTAALLLNEYGDLDNVLANAHNIKQNARRQAIQGAAEIVALSKKLVALDRNVKLEVTLDDLRIKPIEPARLLAFLEEQNFRSLIAKVKKEFPIEENSSRGAPRVRANVATIITQDSQLVDIINQAKRINSYSLYFQNNFLHNQEIKTIEDIAGIALCMEQELFYFPVSSSAADNLFSFNNSQQAFSFSHLIKSLGELFNDHSLTLVVYDQKLLMHLLKQAQAKMPNNMIRDVMVMSYSLGCAKTGNEFEHLITHYLGEHDTIIENNNGITKLRAAITELDQYTIANYVTKKAKWLFMLNHFISAQLQTDRLTTLYEKIDRWMPAIVFQMEDYGVKLDGKVIEELAKELDQKIQALELEIYKIAGYQFNIASPKQLADLLFNKMGIDAGKKSKSGNFSTGVEILEELQQQGHTIADLLLDWRRLYKLKTTYTDSLVKQINPATGRVHTNFSYTITSTGRFSSNDPNLQNIPASAQWGSKIRAAFIAEPGYKIVSLDYSQIELRLLAHLADIDALKKAFAEGKDIHAITASEIFGVEVDAVDQDLRRKAKAINFGIIYGISGFGLAKNLGIDRSRANEYIKLYFEKYPGILQYMDSTKEFARKHGYVETISGRRCFVPEINSNNPTLRAFAERAAINAPLQGSAADIIRSAMVQIHKTLPSTGLDAKMIMQVHDELIFEVKERDVEELQKYATGVMENVKNLSVVLKVDSEVADHW